MTNDILSSYPKSSITIFHKDITQLVRVAEELNRYYGEFHSDLDKDIKKYQEWLKNFNKKYKGITLKVVLNIDSTDTKLLLNEESIFDVFNNAASRIAGMKSAGVKKAERVDISAGDSFMNEVQRGKKQLFLTYFDPDTGNRTIFLMFDEKEKKVEIKYDPNEIIHQTNPEFILACFYALKDGIDKDINLFDEGATFGFQDVLFERDKAKYYRKFHPRFIE